MYVWVLNFFLTLPEGEKDDWLDHEELEHGVVRDEQFTRGKVKEEESVERQTDGDVVDDSHIQVATSHAGGERYRNKECALAMIHTANVFREETKKLKPFFINMQR